MGIYAYHNPEGGDEARKERAKRLKLDDMIRSLEGHQATVSNNLMMWLRCHEHPQGAKQAQQAMERLLEARNEENKLFRQLFGLTDDHIAIGKG